MSYEPMQHFVLRAPIVFDGDGRPFFWKGNERCYDFAQLGLPEKYKKYARLDGSHWNALIDPRADEEDNFQGDIYNMNPDWIATQFSDQYNMLVVTKELFDEFAEFVEWVCETGIQYNYELQVW